MAQNEWNNGPSKVHQYLQGTLPKGGQSLKSGDGGGTFDDMEARVKILEAGMARIEPKLDALIASVAEMKGQLNAMPSAATFGDLKGAVGKLEGRVEGLPSLGKIAAIVTLVGAAMTIIIKWSALVAALPQ